MLRIVTLSVALAALAWAQDPIAPHSAMEPPATKAAASLSASTKASPPDLLTTGEKSDWNETAPYAEAVEISRRLERASRFVKVLDIGTTPEGRSMIALVVSKDRAFTPEAAARTGKVVMLIQSGIHAGEIEGKDTALMLVRDMVVSKKYAAWLDHIIFVIIPVFNVDGHEYFSPYHRPSQNGPKSTGLRADSQRMNLNRDYIKADTPEMRAWLKIFNTWNPDFHIDNHVTDGSDFQYDVTWDMARNQDIAEPAGAWVRERFVPELDKRMAADGHLVAPYGALRNAGGKREFFMEVFTPRYSHLYAAVQNRPSLLVETHSLKAAKTRAWAHDDIMRETIETILLDPEGLRKAVREADRLMAARAGDRSAPAVYLAGKVSDTQKPLEQEFETYRFSNIKFAANSNEGHVALSFDARPVKEKMLIPAGSYWVPLKPRRGRLAMAMLEPQVPDSLAMGAHELSIRDRLRRRSRRISVGTDRAPHDVRQPRIAQVVRGETGRRPAVCGRHAGAFAVVVPAIEIRSGRRGRYPIARVWEKNW